MRRSYLDYAMSVIVARALPDVRDGLKPVHRRILYAMREGGYDWSKPYRKAAKMVGEVMGNYHPHGDLAIYDALVRMAQDFSMRLQLVDGQGNFGSMDGDPPAAMRYTEVRLARAAHDLLEDIDRETGDFQPNYDDTTQEPSGLPAKNPNLLVNGPGGIPEWREESARDGVRVVVEIKRDAVADVVLNQLYRYTPLQSTFGIIMLALDHQRPVLMTLKHVLTAFIAFREEVIRRRTL